MSRMPKFDGRYSGWQNLALTAQAGWSISGSQARIRRDGLMVYVEAEVTRTGAVITPSGAGNFNDVPMFTGIPIGYRPTFRKWIDATRPGILTMKALVEASGAVTLTHSTSVGGLNPGDTLELYGCWMLG